MKNLINKLKKVLLNHIEDFLIIVGLLSITSATFALNPIAGVYVVGVVCLGLGIYFVKFPIDKGR